MKLFKMNVGEFLSLVHLKVDWKILIKIPVTLQMLWSLFKVTYLLIRGIVILFLVSITNIGILKGISDYDVEIVCFLYFLDVLAHAYGLWWFLKCLDSKKWSIKLISPIFLLLPFIVIFLFAGVLWIDTKISFLNIWNAFVFVTDGPTDMYTPHKIRY